MHFSQRLVEREAFSFDFPSQELMYKKKGLFFSHTKSQSGGKL